jgi:hypothetical protein
MHTSKVTFFVQASWFWGNHAEERMCQNSSVVCTFHSLLNVQKTAAVIHFEIGSILVCGEIGSKGLTVG